jgi:hypothetical protein
MSSSPKETTSERGRKKKAVMPKALPSKTVAPGVSHAFCRDVPVACRS